MPSIIIEAKICCFELMLFYKAFLRDIKSSNLSAKERSKIKRDYMKELVLHRYRFNEYFYQFEFPKLSCQERRKFISVSEMQHIYRKYGASDVREIFRDKSKFLDFFKMYIKRQWMLWDGDMANSLNELKNMLNSFDCIIKPFAGTLGDGVKKIARNSVTDVEKFIKNNLLDGKYVVEECISAHPEIAEFHPASLNTIRVVTFSNGKKSKVFGAFLRMGNNNSCIDNAHGGGIFAQIDIDSGLVISDGIDTCRNIYELHPFSKKKIRGFIIPNWEKVKEMCIDASLVLPKIRFAGWDVAIRADGKMEFVEGNHAPDFDLMQSPLKIGVRAKVYQFMNELEIN